jgi:AbiV family abortive infection protein
LTKKRLNQYKGRLSVEQIAEGINAALQNASRLVEDAKLLLERKRFPSASSLAILAVEEAGKVSILKMLAVAKDQKAVAKYWQEYRCHTKKNVAWLLPVLVAQGARRLDDFRPLFREDSAHPFILDQVKQLGFYTDCLGQAHWSIPEEVIDESLATNLIKIAEIFSQGSKASAQEMELWTKHLAPVWMTDTASMKQALANWWTEMQELGLAPEGDQKIDGMGLLEFIDGMDHS